MWAAVRMLETLGVLEGSVWPRDDHSRGARMLAQELLGEGGVWTMRGFERSTQGLRVVARDPVRRIVAVRIFEKNR